MNDEGGFMRSLSYKTLIWHSTWFKHNCAQSHTENTKTAGDYIGEAHKHSENQQNALPQAKPGFFHWLKRSPRA